ncbi:MAG TPA: hypothetical protein VJ720_14760 [Chitinophaga sp.]|nr:hypothetical protein [Chitinophaga sp.]
MKYNNGYSGRNIVQRHGPGYQNTTYVEADNVHLDRHLDVWERHFPEVKTIEDVRGIARQLFDRTKQGDWKNKGGSYAVDHKWRGQTVRLVWGIGGITSCFIVEPRVSGGTQPGGTQYQPSYQQLNNSYQQPQTSYQQPQPSYQQLNNSYQQPQTSYQQPQPSYQQLNNSYQQQQTTYQPAFVTHNGYRWTSDFNWWWDPVKNQWRARVEQGYDWYYA